MYDDIDRLAELHMEMWWLDDERNYPRLKGVSKELFLLEGFNSSKAERASSLVTDAYREYKIAKENKNSESVRELHLEKTKQLLLATYGALSLDNRDALLHYNWWNNFFRKNYLPIPFILLRQHLVKFKGDVLSAVLCTAYITLAGYIGHDPRDKQKTVHYLKKYWDTVKTSGKQIAMF